MRVRNVPVVMSACVLFFLSLLFFSFLCILASTRCRGKIYTRFFLRESILARAISSRRFRFASPSCWRS